MVTSNPYGTSTTILDPAKFWGRTETLDYLFAEIVAERCVSIVGVRRIGKSSLLRALCMNTIQQRFASLYDLQKFLFIYIDLGEFLSKTINDFFLAVCQQLIAQCQSRLILETFLDEQPEDRFWLLLDQIQSQDFHTVLLFDAFHKITQNTHFDAKFFSFMRAQANNGRVSYITASIIPLDKCLHPYIEDSPFFNIFSQYRLGPLSEEEAHESISHVAATVGMPFTEAEVAAILHLAGRHPFFIQRVAFYFFQAKLHQQVRPAILKRETLEDLMPHFKDIWGYSLDTQQRELVREEVRWKDVGQRKLPELNESLLFRKFVRDTFHIGMVHMTADDIGSILHNLDDAKFLSECVITQLHLFSTHSHHPSLSNYERAAIVRKILQEARDKLRPESKYSDAAPEWLFFNILSYSFFARRLKNEALAQLLDIGVRQLQRKRIQAIEALFDIVSDMEMEARELLE